MWHSLNRKAMSEIAQKGSPDLTLTVKVSWMLLVLTGKLALTSWIILGALTDERESTLRYDSEEAFFD